MFCQKVERAFLNIEQKVAVIAFRQIFGNAFSYYVVRRGERHFVRGVVHDKAVLVTDTRIKGHQFRAELFLHIVHQRLCVLGRYFGRSVVNHRLLLIRFVGGKRHEIAAESKIRFAHFYAETSCFKR